MKLAKIFTQKLYNKVVLMSGSRNARWSHKHTGVQKIGHMKAVHIWKRPRKRKSKRYYIHSSETLNWKPVGKRMAKQKNSPRVVSIFCPLFLPIFSKLSKWQNRTVSITGRQMFARTLWRSRPRFARMNSCCAKCVNHRCCVNRSCTCCGNVLASLIWHPVSVKISHPSDLSLEYDHIEYWMLWKKHPGKGLKFVKMNFSRNATTTALTRGNCTHALKKATPCHLR